MIPESEERTLAPGMMMSASTFHRDGHRIGGTHQIEGANCPNCGKPLMLHLSLNTSDERLNLSSLPFRWLPLLYCMRCELAHSDFVYRIVGDSAIEILEYIPGEVMPCWEELGIGEAFPESSLHLERLPEPFQRLSDKLNHCIALNEDEKIQYCQTSENWALPRVGGYPVVAAINQLCGRGFLIQSLPDPVFRGEHLMFLASLCNEKRAGVRFTWDGYQIVFWIGLKTHTIMVQHSV